MPRDQTHPFTLSPIAHPALPVDGLWLCRCRSSYCNFEAATSKLISLPTLRRTRVRGADGLGGLIRQPIDQLTSGKAKNGNAP